MANQHEALNVNLELTAITGSQVQMSQQGVPCLIIPLDSNSDLSIYKDKNGRDRVYFPVNLWPKRNADPATGLDQWGFSHDASQSFTKAKRDTLPQGTYPPNIGRAKPIVRHTPSTNPNQVPQGYAFVNQQDNQGTPIGGGNTGDMPF
jgi:hypothetical protein